MHGGRLKRAGRQASYDVWHWGRCQVGRAGGRSGQSGQSSRRDARPGAAGAWRLPVPAPCRLPALAAALRAAIALKNSPHAVRPHRRQCPRCARLNFQVLAVANTMLNMSRFMPASDAPLEEAGRLGPQAEMRAGSAPNVGEAGGGRRAGCRMVRALRLRALARYRRGGSLARHGNFQASVIWMPHIRRS